MSSNNTESFENVCVVCFKNVEIFSIGSCDHMVCYECSTRMRVLCRQNECPICRQELPRVVFTNTVKPFNEIQNCSPLEDKKFKISFQSRKIQECFYKLLEHCCSVCPNSPSFKAFQNLYDHMKEQHNLFYCDLCVEHLKIFTSERQCYTQKNLDQHKRHGDADDKSHRGHPLCQFCDIRFMDNDCLYRHLRRDHLFCHFCDADGFDLYYSSYDYLLEHFRTEHYLCEEGSCVDEKFTPVFRTDIDLKAHRASAHGRTLGKVAAKQARTLELEFTLKPRPRQRDGSRRRRPASNNASSSEGAVGGSMESSLARPNLPNFDFNAFPSLPSVPGANSIILPQQRGRTGGLSVHAVGRRNAPLAITDENFPVLGVNNDSSLPGTSVRLNINQETGASGRNINGTSRNVSIHVNHKANGEKNIRIRQDDFPALNSESKSQPGLTTPKWTCITNKKSATPSVSSSVSKATKKLHADNDFPSLNSKFSTNLNLKVSEPPKPDFVNIKTFKENKVEGQKNKKASWVTIPVKNDLPESETASSSTLKAKSKKKKSKGNVAEEKLNTMKKKEGKEFEIKGEGDEKDSKDQPKSALSISSNSPQEKPLPKVEDWFEELKKPDKKGDSNEYNPATSVSSNATKFSFSEIPPVTELACGGFSNNSSCNGNDKKVSKKINTKVPPGFNNVNGSFNNNDVMRPPPGFSVNFPKSNGLTFTNSSGQSFAISTNFEYLPPVDFEKRNQNLVSKVNKIMLNDGNLEQFRKMSILFRQSVLSAKEYYEHCVKTMGEARSQEIFPELLVLLPDISKQQELYQVYSQSSIFSKGGKSLKSCETCLQVIYSSDVKNHAANHSMDENFPVLGGGIQWTK